MLFHSGLFLKGQSQGPHKIHWLQSSRAKHKTVLWKHSPRPKKAEGPTEGTGLFQRPHTHTMEAQGTSPYRKIDFSSPCKILSWRRIFLRIGLGRPRPLQAKPLHVSLPWLSCSKLIPLTTPKKILFHDMCVPCEKTRVSVMFWFIDVTGFCHGSKLITKWQFSSAKGISD